MAVVHRLNQHPAPIRELKLDEERVSVNSGEIALENPLNYTGAKLSVQALRDLARQSKKLALVTMRVGATGVVEPLS